MKKIVYIILLIVNTSSFGQNISLNELFSMCNKTNWVEVNECLLRKNWEYYESSKGDDENYSTITWAFNKESYSDKAQGWLYLYTFEGLPNKISYSFFNTQSYNTIKSGLVSSGLKLIEKSIEDNELIVKYEGASFIVSIATAKREEEESYDGDNSITAYSVDVVKKEGIYDTANGNKIIYYENGNIKAEYYLLNGELNGQTKAYNENGILERTGNFINGIENGKFIEYDEEGNKTSDYQMVNGKVKGIKTVYENGLKKIEAMKRDNINYGKYIEYTYDENNILVLKYVGSMINDTIDGLFQNILIQNGKEEVIQYITYSMGVRNGPFKEFINSDTIVSGVYKDGKLNGYFKQEIKTRGYLQNNTNEKFSWWNLESEGNYINGYKSGKWIYYLTGNKSEEGNYLLGLKNGNWISYLGFGDQAQEIFTETNYKNDKEDGLFKRHFYMELIQDSADGNDNFTFNSIPIEETYYYKDGLREGDYVYKDSSGVLISKGKYSGNMKSGYWTESYQTEDSSGKFNRIYNSGNYVLDKKEGEWNEYITLDNISEIRNYKDGKLDGKLIIYDSNKIKKEVFSFVGDTMHSLEVYDSLGVNILYKYQLNFIKKNVINCFHTLFKDNIYVTQAYEYVSFFDDFNFYLFDLDFKLSVLDTAEVVFDELYHTEIISNDDLKKPAKDEFISDPIRITAYTSEVITSKTKGWKKEGLYEFGEIYPARKLIVGNFTNNFKEGDWITMYYENDIYVTQNYHQDVSSVEMYSSIVSNQPYTGVFKLKHTNSIPKCEFKISDGLRNGKSKYFDDAGIITKTEKYNKGKLVD